MIDEPPHNGLLAHLDDIKTYIVGGFVVFGALLTHYLSIRKRLISLELTSVTHEQLLACRDDVRSEDVLNTAKMMLEIKDIAEKTEKRTEKTDARTEALALKNQLDHEKI